MGRPVISQVGANSLNNLSNWLQNTFDASWQSLEAIFSSTDSRKLSLRSVSLLSEVRVVRGKIIDLGLKLGSLSVALVIAITPDTEDKLEIFVSVHPVASNKYLPSTLRLKLLSETSQVLQDVESRSNDNYIQLRRFKGYSGERFNIVVTFSDYTITEHFII